MPYFVCSKRYYRLALVSVRDKQNKAIPAVRNFTLHPGDQGKLSVDCECFTTSEETIARVGASYKSNNTFKNYNDREIYAIDANFITESELINGVIYDPVIVHPKQKGRPENFSHSLLDLVLSNPNELEPEICLKLREHAKDKRVLHDIEKTHELVTKYRAQWDNKITD